MQLQPQLLNFKTLLNGRLFKIPGYQRAYSWEKKQREDLFEDIKRIKDYDEDHFMATVVGLLREHKKIAADKFAIVDIVDGQQRLTTLIILLKAIQKALDSTKQTEKKLSDELSELLVKGDDFNLLLLQTNHDSSQLFADYIRAGSIPASNASTSADQNITDAISESEEFVAKWKELDPSLVELVGIIWNRLWVVFHSVEQEKLVYRVFEVLNSRGLDVSWIDKLKSQLMGLAFDAGESGGSDEAIRELHQIWQEIYRTIGQQKHLTAETVRFAGTLRALTAPSRPLSEAASVQRLVEFAGAKSRTVVECAKWLQSVVKAEEQLLSNHRWRAVTQILQARLVAIAVLLRRFSKREQDEILGRWERVSFRIYGLNGSDARTKVGDYTRLAWRISNEKLSATEILNGLGDIGKDYPISEVIKKFDPSNCYEGWTEELRYILYRYDEHLAEEAGEKLNELQWSKIWAQDPAKSIEHIQPQSSGEGYVHNLGNLMMVPPGLNSQLQDDDPSTKLNSYRTSGLRSSIDVADRIAKAKWGKRAVEKRSKEILNWASEQWAD